MFSIAFKFHSIYCNLINFFTQNRTHFYKIFLHCWTKTLGDDLIVFLVENICLLFRTCCRFKAGTDLSSLEPQILPNVAAIVLAREGTTQLFGGMKKIRNYESITKNHQHFYTITHIWYIRLHAARCIKHFDNRKMWKRTYLLAGILLT